MLIVENKPSTHCPLIKTPLTPSPPRLRAPLPPHLGIEEQRTYRFPFTAGRLRIAEERISFAYASVEIREIYGPAQFKLFPRSPRSLNHID